MLMYIVAKAILTSRRYEKNYLHFILITIILTKKIPRTTYIVPKDSEEGKFSS